jgi:hypothetical protein
MRHASTIFRFAVLFAILAGCATAPTTFAGERIVAIGDIHGNYDGFLSILQRAGLVDDDAHWIGGDTTFVQTGDIFDRGLEVFEVLDLLMRLEKEAAAAGGEVIVLLGNHEGMNLVGFFRDVNPELYATMVDKKSEKRRKQAYKQFKKYWRAEAEKILEREVTVVPEEIKEQWMAAIPPGWLEYKAALGPGTHYGSWLRQRPVAVVIDETLFVHGGIGPHLAGLSVDEINAKVVKELEIYDRLREVMIKENLVPTTAELASLMNVYLEMDPKDPKYAELADAEDWFVFSEKGPLWFRGADRWDEELETEHMIELLAGVGAKRMVGGHTVQDEGRIEVRFGGRVFLIDTGMLSSVYTGGQPSALVIEDGVFTAIYTDGSSEELATEEELKEAA